MIRAQGGEVVADADHGLPEGPSSSCGPRSRRCGSAFCSPMSPVRGRKIRCVASGP